MAKPTAGSGLKDAAQRNAAVKIADRQQKRAGKAARKVGLSRTLTALYSCCMLSGKRTDAVRRTAMPPSRCRPPAEAPRGGAVQATFRTCLLLHVIWQADAMRRTAMPPSRSPSALRSTLARPPARWSATKDDVLYHTKLKLSGERRCVLAPSCKAGAALLSPQLLQQGGSRS